ncbi:hypothetical protein ACOSQ4_028395 [Xanthoceras sorbifolium]
MPLSKCHRFCNLSSFQLPSFLVMKVQTRFNAYPTSWCSSNVELLLFMIEFSYQQDSSAIIRSPAGAKRCASDCQSTILIMLYLLYMPYFSRV